MPSLQTATSVKQLIQNMAPQAMDIEKGTVISDNPLLVQLINDEKITLNQNTLCVPEHLGKYTLQIDGSNVTIDNSLKKNDLVYLLSFNFGKQYYILDRAVNE